MATTTVSVAASPQREVLQGMRSAEGEDPPASSSAIALDVVNEWAIDLFFPRSAHRPALQRTSSDFVDNLSRVANRALRMAA